MGVKLIFLLDLDLQVQNTTQMSVNRMRIQFKLQIFCLQMRIMRL